VNLRAAITNSGPKYKKSTLTTAYSSQAKEVALTAELNLLLFYSAFLFLLLDSFGCLVTLLSTFDPREREEC
jgi:hypothetical protein